MTTTARGVDTSGLEARIEVLDNKLDKVSEATIRIEAGQMQRSEVYAELAKRVSVETYSVTLANLLERISKLEASPQRLMMYLGVGGGCAGTLIGGASLCVTIILAIIHH